MRFLTNHTKSALNSHNVDCSKAVGNRVVIQSLEKMSGLFENLAQKEWQPCEKLVNCMSLLLI